jgi:opacity protein-like surface antigen
MKRQLMFIPAIMLILAAPALAANGTRGHWGEDQVFRIDIGQFQPKGDSTYWEDVEFDFTSKPADFEDVVVGVEWVKFLGDRLGLAVSGTFYEGSDTMEYRAYEDQFGGGIRHRTDLEVSSLMLGLLVHLTQRDKPIVPYIGGGGGFWAWRLTESGDFIDFLTPDLEIFPDYFEDEGDAVGFYWRAGIEVPLAPNWALYAEGRWQDVDDELGGDFEGLGNLDLSGTSYSAGLSISF